MRRAGAREKARRNRGIACAGSTRHVNATMESTAKRLKLAPGKLIATVDRHGNTSAASIPLALSVAVADGRIKRGDLVMLEAMGGGFTWGAVLLRW